MNITTKSEYGLRAMYLLKENYNNTVPIAKMVKDLNISKTYLEQLFRRLKKNNLVESFRGKEGGYRLSRKPNEITLGQIIRALEGDINLSSKCNSNHICSSIDCITRSVFFRIDSAVNSVIDNITLSDI